jgi:hypothetical protein
MGKPLMDPQAFKALPHAEKQDRVKEFYGAAWRHKCDLGNHSCQNPAEHEASYHGVMGSAYKGEDFADKDVRTLIKHQPPDYVGGATQVGGPLSDYHGYTDGKPNPNPWPMSEADAKNRWKGGKP